MKPNAGDKILVTQAHNGWVLVSNEGREDQFVAIASTVKEAVDVFCNLLLGERHEIMRQQFHKLDAEGATDNAKMEGRSKKSAFFTSGLDVDDVAAEGHRGPVEKTVSMSAPNPFAPGGPLANMARPAAQPVVETIEQTRDRVMAAVMADQLRQAVDARLPPHPESGLEWESDGTPANPVIPIPIDPTGKQVGFQRAAFTAAACASGEAKANIASGEWGHLPGEPCRFCRVPGGVCFMLDEGPEGKSGLQINRCTKCSRCWTSDSANA